MSCGPNRGVVSKQVVSSYDHVIVIVFQPCFLDEPCINVLDMHPMNEVFQFGSVPLAVVDDGSFGVSRSTP